ncbi:oxidoreductase-like protein [Apodospora peruviana]|uniref:Oxidoreductase-like protein n=1 Tax=Apodospora peruviana TaxID=516989 RepID=A0AAE0IAU9_9PEZI|nr:oxidoreductase-like protein [Apodospora peruviana]
MGLLGFFSTEEEKRAADVRKGVVAPTRAERQKCWEARDGFFACLDANNIVDPIKEDKAAAKACRQESAKFEENCAEKWVVYFKQWRVQDIQKKRRLAELEAQGGIKMDVNTDFTARK